MYNCKKVSYFNSKYEKSKKSFVKTQISDNENALIKVSQFQNVFLVSTILPRNKQKIRLYFYVTSNQIFFVHFLGEFEDTKKKF